MNYNRIYGNYINLPTYKEHIFNLQNNFLLYGVYVNGINIITSTIIAEESQILNTIRKWGWKLNLIVIPTLVVMSFTTHFIKWRENKLIDNYFRSTSANTLNPVAVQPYGDNAYYEDP